MAQLYMLIRLILTITSAAIVAEDMERTEFCNDLKCDLSSNASVCGIRYENAVVQYKLFKNECELLKYGCSVEDKDAYGLIGMKYCLRSLSRKFNVDISAEIHKASYEFMQNQEKYTIMPNKIPNKDNTITQNAMKSVENECKAACNASKDYVCGIRPDGEGYRVKLFENKCELKKYNCYTPTPFTQTNKFICDGTFGVPNASITDGQIKTRVGKVSAKNDVRPLDNKNIIVVDGTMLGRINDVNETIDNFFAATHVLDLPMREIEEKELKTRRMLLKTAGPIKVFQPWITIPKKIETDYFHAPLLSTCYHKCPTHCPDTYAPVCGVPGIRAREPSLMFKNHCYMDVAQCKMYWENKSSTAISSSYIESSFLFCLGDQLNGLYRFLPLIRTLQHMGRLKKKGKFTYKLKNMRFFNNFAEKEPKIMG